MRYRKPLTKCLLVMGAIAFQGNCQAAPYSFAEICREVEKKKGEKDFLVYLDKTEVEGVLEKLPPLTYSFGQIPFEPNEVVAIFFFSEEGKDKVELLSSKGELFVAEAFKKPFVFKQGEESIEVDPKKVYALMTASSNNECSKGEGYFLELKSGDRFPVAFLTDEIKLSDGSNEVLLSPTTILEVENGGVLKGTFLDAAGEVQTFKSLVIKDKELKVRVGKGGKAISIPWGQIVKIAQVGKENPEQQDNLQSMLEAREQEIARLQTEVEELLRDQERGGLETEELLGKLDFARAQGVHSEEELLSAKSAHEALLRERDELVERLQAANISLSSLEEELNASKSTLAQGVHSEEELLNAKSAYEALLRERDELVEALQAAKNTLAQEVHSEEERLNAKSAYEALLRERDELVEVLQAAKSSLASLEELARAKEVTDAQNLDVHNELARLTENKSQTEMALFAANEQLLAKSNELEAQAKEFQELQEKFRLKELMFEQKNNDLELERLKEAISARENEICVLKDLIALKNEEKEHETGSLKRELATRDGALVEAREKSRVLEELLTKKELEGKGFQKKQLGGALQELLSQSLEKEESLKKDLNLALKRVSELEGKQSVREMTALQEELQGAVRVAKELEEKLAAATLETQKKEGALEIALMDRSSEEARSNELKARLEVLENKVSEAAVEKSVLEGAFEQALLWQASLQGELLDLRNDKTALSREIALEKEALLQREEELLGLKHKMQRHEEMAQKNSEEFREAFERALAEVDTLSQSDDAYRQLREDLVEVYEELKGAHANYQAILSEKERLVADLALVEESLGKERGAREEQIARLEGELTAARGEHGDALAREKSLQEERSTQQEQIARLEAELQALQGNHSDAIAREKSLQEERSTQQEQIARLEGELQALQGNHSDAIAREKSLQDERSATQEQIARLEGELQALQGNHSDAIAREKSLQEERNTQQEQIARLEGDLLSARGEHKNFQEERNALELERGTILKELSKTKDALEMNIAWTEEMKRALEYSDEEVRRLLILESDHARLQETYARMQEELEHFAVQSTMQLAEIQALKEEGQKPSSQIALAESLENKLRLAEVALTEAEENHRLLRGQIREVEGQQNQMLQEREKLAQELAWLQDSIAQERGEKMHLEAALVDYKGQFAKLEENYQEAKEALELKVREEQKALARLEEVLSENNQTKEALVHFENLLESAQNKVLSLTEREKKATLLSDQIKAREEALQLELQKTIAKAEDMEGTSRSFHQVLAQNSVEKEELLRQIQENQEELERLKQESPSQERLKQWEENNKALEKKLQELGQLLEDEKIARQKERHEMEKKQEALAEAEDSLKTVLSKYDQEKKRSKQLEGRLDTLYGELKGSIETHVSDRN